MRKTLQDILRCPQTQENLRLYPFEVRDDDVIEGLLVGEKSKHAYAITHGVPVMLGDHLTRTFVDSWRREIEHISGQNACSLARPARVKDDWSFSREWQQHSDNRLKRTWGWSAAQRAEMFLLENDVTPDWCQGKRFLDAGCGNGQLTERVADFGARVIGIDYSTSVFSAERNRRSDQVHFVRGDLTRPPFAPASFDLVFSNGVLHHTPDTRITFGKVAALVSEGGKFYLWLYKRPEGFWRRQVLLPLLDAGRFAVARSPHALQKYVVHAWAAMLYLKHKAGRRPRRASFAELVTASYDGLTPLWRHYHTPQEVASWFYKAGYSAPALTHWDNPYGFGMNAVRSSRSRTPGVNFHDHPGGPTKTTVRTACPAVEQGRPR